MTKKSKVASVKAAPPKMSVFEENKKRSEDIQKKLREAYPMAGNTGGEDQGWRSLTGGSTRDLNQLTQKRMQEIAFYLFDTNPMAHRLVEIMRDFVVGDGWSVVAKDKSVQEVIDKFLSDPDNDFDCTLDENVQELCLFGENCFPVWVNSADGSVKLGYIDPAWIIKVKKDPRNPRWNKSIIYQRPNAREPQELSLIRSDKAINSETNGYLVGQAFYFAINKPINATRGRSDLLSLADWLDGHDQFLFARLERAFLTNTFIWDIEAQGMNASELEEFVKGIASPKPGSIRAHNEKVKWNAVSPKLEAEDASNESRLFKNQILGGAGYPEHWFGEGSTTTRATALEMGLPTLKKLKSRQKKIKYFYCNIIQFVIHQAIIAGTLKDTVDQTFKIIVPPIISRDDRVLAQAMSSFVDALTKAYDIGWIKDFEARSAFKTIISQVGLEQFSESGQYGEDKDAEGDKIVDQRAKNNSGAGRTDKNNNSNGKKPYEAGRSKVNNALGGVNE